MNVRSIMSDLDTHRVARLFARLSPAVIAIDGPAASGKSTVGYQLAELAHFLFFDTGVLYRAVTWAALEQGIAVTDEQAVSALAQQVEIDISAPSIADGRQNTILVDGEDVTWKIRTPQVDQNVSAVSAYPLVRQALGLQQKRIAQRYGRGEGDKPGVVMVGRDIGTVIMPEAALKIYMDASAVERARRRQEEQAQRGRQIPSQAVLEDLLRRDRLDSERAYAPLRPAEDALIIDTSQLTPSEVLAEIVRSAEQKLQ